MFFLEMPYLARQEIGELFFVLMIMVMVEKNLSRRQLSILTVFFIPALFSITLFTGLHLHVPTYMFISGDFNQEFEFNL